MTITYHDNFKEKFERLCACAALILLLPFLLIITIIIKSTSTGPVLYTQHRTGHKGLIFRIYKFRSMYQHLCDNGKTQATFHDIRITPFGRIMRKYYIDEIPQLFNVIKGDMNLIGPRPHAVTMDHYYADQRHNYWRRYNQKLGMTGWAQIHKLHGETKTQCIMMKRVAYDVWYHKKKSFIIDCMIGYHTLCMVLRLR